MRIGLIPEGLADWLKLRSRRLPLPLFDVMGTMLLSRAVMAGVHFGVFDWLAGGPRTAEEVARETRCQPEGMALLLEALATCGYLEKRRSRFRNSSLSDRWLRTDAPQSLANFVRFNYDQWEWMSHLEEFLAQGSARNIHERLDERGWRTYLFGLRDLARLSAAELAARLRFPRPPRRLLDVGGGHGEYAAALCRRFPDLRATVVDLEAATSVGRAIVEREGLSHRVEFRPGGVAEADFGSDYDVAFFFNLAHHLDEATNRATLEKLHRALAVEGRLVIAEPFRDDREGRQRDQLGALLALFFGVTSRVRTYSFAEMAAWARAAGFRRIEKKKLRAAPFAALLVAQK